MRAGLYVRVSTLNHGQTTANQRKELEAYCERQGWKVADVYDDTGISGSKEDRPALDRMLKDVMAHRFDVLVTWKIDRLGRSVIHLLQVLQQIQAAGISFVATTQNLDTSTPHGRMVVTLLAGIAEFERELIKERVLAGMKRAKAEGVRIGRPRVAIDVRRALELKASGLGYLQIARQLGVPRSTLHRTLSAIPKASAA